MKKSELPFAPRTKGARIDKSALAFRPGAKAAPPPREGNSTAHLKWIRDLPCLAAVAMGEDPASAAPAREAHHLLGGTDRGMGKKASDQWTVPLAHIRHMDMHNLGEARYFEALGIDDPKAVAKALWERSGDRPAALAWLEENVRGRGL